MSAARRGARTGAVDVVVIGAGHSGLAMSALLSQHGIDHVVLERGEVANSWRRERWDSLRLLTPNWLSRLPGHRYDGDDPHGFMALPEVIEFIDDYARVVAAPVRAGVTVTSVTEEDGDYRVSTDSREWRCRAVVLASGAFGKAARACHRGGAAAVGAQPRRRRNTAGRRISRMAACWWSVLRPPACNSPTRSSASGRQVTLAVGEHIRTAAQLSRARHPVVAASRSASSISASMRSTMWCARGACPRRSSWHAQRATLDLNALTGRGVEIVGRVAGIRDGQGAVLRIAAQ